MGANPNISNKVSLFLPACVEPRVKHTGTASNCTILTQAGESAATILGGEDILKGILESAKQEMVR